MTKKANSTKGGDSSSKVDRKTIEKNRRIHMKALCLKLSSIVPPNYIKLTKDIPSQLEQVDIATAYIKDLRERVKELKRKKDEATEKRKTKWSKQETNERSGFNNNNREMILPSVEMRELESGIEVVLVSGLKNKNFMLYEVVSVIEEEGAQVVAVSYTVLGNKIFYTLHAQVKITRVGVNTTRVYQRLHELIAPLFPEHLDLLLEDDPHFPPLPCFT